MTRGVTSARGRQSGFAEHERVTSTRWATRTSGQFGAGRLLRMILAGVIAGCVAGADGVRGDEPVNSAGRVGANRKGSLLIYPLVEVRWDSADSVTRDTFITLSNDYSEGVWIQLYYVNGDPPLAATDTEREHSGWNRVGMMFPLTSNEPTYWSAATGLPRGLSPFIALDPGSPPGRPDPDPVPNGERVLRGYVIAWAVDPEGREVRWNHLTASALTVDYGAGTAWEYSAWAFQVHSSPHGMEPVNCLAFNLESGQCVDEQVVPGQLDLDGYEYDACGHALLFNFAAVGATLPDLAGWPVVSIDTRLALFPCDVDLRQDNGGPVTTKARFAIWNENEIQFSGTDRCITCWDLSPLSHYTDFGVPNHFLVEMLQTDRGKARIYGGASTVCDVEGRVSQDAALLGVVQRLLEFPGTTDEAGVPLTIQGQEVAQVLCDIPEPPEEKPEGGEEG